MAQNTWLDFGYCNGPDQMYQDSEERALPPQSFKAVMLSQATVTFALSPAQLSLQFTERGEKHGILGQNSYKLGLEVTHIYAQHKCYFLVFALYVETGKEEEGRGRTPRGWSKRCRKQQPHLDSRYMVALRNLLLCENTWCLSSHILPLP